MKNDVAVKRLAALAQTSRLAVFRMLVQKGPDGMSAGEIAGKLKMAPNALSFHLKELSHAGLVNSRPEGRFVIYSPDFKAMNGLLGYLTENCCEGSKKATACAQPPNARNAEMKRFHVHVSVKDLSESISFYSKLFGAEPSVTKLDYAKWMLDDPDAEVAGGLTKMRPATKGTS